MPVVFVVGVVKNMGVKTVLWLVALPSVALKALLSKYLL